MNIVIVSDAWVPQVNGVVRTLEAMSRELRALGHRVEVIGPAEFPTMPMPSYPEIRLALLPYRRLTRRIEAMQPCAIHIATEGPLGHAARRYCRRRGLPFTTAVHTLFPEYIHARIRLPVRLSYAYMRWFHRPATRVMVATDTVEQQLHGRGFGRLTRWTRGVDTALYRPRPDDRDFLNLPRPIWLNVGRVAVEKNIEAFLSLDLPGSKLVVGDGPQRTALQRRFPDAHFAGAKFGDDLARHYAAADAFVFPSRTDTFGLVVLEALACGLPVAAYPVQGPRDLLEGSGVGVLDEDLGRAARAALAIPRDACVAFADSRGWRRSAEQFLAALAPFETDWAA